MRALSRLVNIAFVTVLLLTGAASAGSRLSAAAPASLVGAPRILLQGPQPFLTILCKLAGVAAEPEPPAYFNNLVAEPGDGLSDYWREVSYGNISLDGSAATGWHDLAGDSASYVGADGQVDLDRLAADCIGRGVAGRDLRRFAGLGLVFNADLDSRPRAGTACIDLPGTRECFNVVWMWPAWLHSEAAWAHEMGHVFGLPHSSDPSGGDYANAWDVMSGFAGCSCGRDHNSVPQHPIAYQLDRLGWIPDARRYVASAEQDATVQLERTAQPSSAGYLVALIPTSTPERYYTVEARGHAGFDVHTPGAAILIHEIDRSRVQQPARLVLKPGSAPGAVASGMWQPGDQFVSTQDLVRVSIVSAAPSGYVVIIRTGSEALRRAEPSGSGELAAAITASTDWSAGARVLALAAGAPAHLIVVSARSSATGMSPTIQVTEGSGATWSAPMQLASGWSSAPGDAPAVAAGPAGAAAIAWSGWSHPAATMSAGAITTADIWLVQRNGPGDWTVPVRVDDGPAGTTQISPAIAIDGRGRIFAAWEDQRSGNADIYFAEATAGTVVRSRRINDDAGRAPQNSPTLAVDDEGNLEVLWVDLRSGAPEIYAARRSTQGVWGGNTRIAAAGPDVHAAPSAAVDERGTVYAAWIAYPACARAKGEVGALMIATRPKGGAWQAPIPFRSGIAGGKESRPAIAAGRAGRMYLAWEEREGARVVVYLATQTQAGAWSPAQRITESAPAPVIRPGLTVDPSSRVYVVSLSDGREGALIAELAPAQ